MWLPRPDWNWGEEVTRTKANGVRRARISVDVSNKGSGRVHVRMVR